MIRLPVIIAPLLAIKRLKAIPPAGYNTALGTYALLNNTTPNDNTAIGAHSQNKNITGADNTAVGYYSLYTNTASSFTYRHRQ